MRTIFTLFLFSIGYQQLKPIINKTHNQVISNCQKENSYVDSVALHTLNEEEKWLVKTIVAESGSDTTDMWRTAQVVLNRLNDTVYYKYNSIKEVVTARKQFSCAPNFENGYCIKKASKQFKIDSTLESTHKAASIARNVLKGIVPTELKLEPTVVFFFNRKISTNVSFVNKFSKNDAVVVSDNGHEFHSY